MFPNSQYRPPNKDVMQNYEADDKNGKFSLQNLLPANMRNVNPIPMQSNDDELNWNRYAPTKEGFSTAISATGQNRMQYLARSSINKKLGSAHPLRPPPNYNRPPTEM